MQSFEGRTAFITGGASGFGFTLAAALLREGMNVVVADVDEQRLDTAAAQLRLIAPAVSQIVCDVSSRDEVRRAADHTLATFGKVHVLCNNAGVLAPGSLEKASSEDWGWSFAVNVMGVINGISAFVPHIRAHDEGGHVVNTASMAGFRGLPYASAYCSTKAAVISISESLLAELEGSNIGVTVLCPGFMRTGLYEHSLDRPARYGGHKTTLADTNTNDPKQLHHAIATGLDPEQVARRTLRAIRENDFYVVTHPQHRPDIAERGERILRAYDRAALDFSVSM